MPIKIDFVSNVREFMRGTSDVERALEDVADSLDDVARDAGRSGDRISDELRDVADEAGDAERAVDELGREIDRSSGEGERSLGRLDRSFKELADAARDTERAADRAGKSVDDVGDAGARGFGRLGDSGAEVADELRGNLGETFSSFRGDLQDLPQIAQDTLGGLAGSGALGGIPGLVATAAGAAGLGMLIGAFEQIGEAQQELEEQAGDWADAYMQAGGKVLTSAQVVERGLTILKDRQGEVTENAKLWGVTEATALAAMAGSSSAIDEVAASLELKTAAAEKDAKAARELAAENGSALLSETLLEAEVRKGRDALNRQREAMEKGAKQADTYSYFLRDLAARTAGAKTKVDEFGDSVTTLPDGTVIYIDAETGQATDDLDLIEKKVFGLPEGKVKLKVDDSAVRSYRPPVIDGTVRYGAGRPGRHHV